MVSLVLAMADQIQPQNIIAYVGDKVELRCEGRYPMWFYEEKQDTTPTTSPISQDQVLNFSATYTHAGYYFCYGKFPQRNRSFLSRVRVQVVNGKL